jgi:hypothetical protein
MCNDRSYGIDAIDEDFKRIGVNDERTVETKSASDFRAVCYKSASKAGATISASQIDSNPHTVAASPARRLRAARSIASCDSSDESIAGTSATSPRRGKRRKM